MPVPDWKMKGQQANHLQTGLHYEWRLSVAVVMNGETGDLGRLVPREP